MPNILIVDDDLDCREMFTLILESAYAITTAADGLAALIAIVTNPPDLILTDDQMPYLSGRRLAAMLAADSIFARIPLLLLSGNPVLPSVGVAAVARKPIRPDDLLAGLAAILTPTPLPGE